MKPMRQSGRREYDAARLHRTVLVANPNHGSAADDVVDLLLLVRLLRIDATAREDVQAEAERGCTEEFKIDLAGAAGRGRGVRRRPSCSDLGESGLVESRQPVVVRPQPLDLARNSWIQST